eukprot:2168590-Prymnesium_polylepis.1
MLIDWDLAQTEINEAMGMAVNLKVDEEVRPPPPHVQPSCPTLMSNPHVQPFCEPLCDHRVTPLRTDLTSSTQPARPNALDLTPLSDPLPLTPHTRPEPPRPSDPIWQVAKKKAEMEAQLKAMEEKFERENEALRKELDGKSDGAKIRAMDQRQVMRRPCVTTM